MTKITSFHTPVKNWWVPLLIGIALVVTSILVVMKPVKAYLALSLLFSWLILVSGLLNITFSLWNRKNMDGWGWYLFLGIIETAIGATMLSNPPLSAEVLLLYMGFWFAFRGAMAIGYAWSFRQIGIKGWGWLMASGILTLLFSFFMVMNPIFGIISIITLTALSFLFLGLFSIQLGWELRKINQLF